MRRPSAVESLLKLRGIREARARRAFLLALEPFRAREAQAADLERRRDEAGARLAAAGTGDLLRHAEYLAALSRRVDRSMAEAAALRADLDRRRRELERASAERKLVERLRERRVEEGKRTAARRAEEGEP